MRIQSLNTCFSILKNERIFVNIFFLVLVMASNVRHSNSSEESCHHRRLPCTFSGRLDLLFSDVERKSSQILYFLRRSDNMTKKVILPNTCLLYTSPSPRDRQKSRMPSSA